jgi:starvation-inducible outer membrane lipoprotein
MRKKNRILLIVAAVVLLLSGCRTTRYVPVKEVRTDTVYKARKDSIHWITCHNVVDSIRWRDSVVNTVDNSGQVKKSEIWHRVDHYHATNDSVNFYKDLLNKEREDKIDSIPAPYPVIKEKKYVPKIYKASMCFSIIIILLAAGYVVVKFKLYKKVKL